MSAEKPSDLLRYLNSEYLKLHKEYEDLFWISYMGDHGVDRKKDLAEKRRNDFSSNEKLREKVLNAVKISKGKEKGRLGYWLKYFDSYQTPRHLKKLRAEIATLETKMHRTLAKAKEGYIDPKTKKFIKASRLKMGGAIRSEPDEALRKAYFMGLEKLTTINLKNYVEYVKLLNKFARGLGYGDFYEYKLQHEEGMTKKELFKIFDSIYKKTKFALKTIRRLEKKMPGLRKPWNFSFMMSGDFTKEEEPYFSLEEALPRWGRSFAALGVNFGGSTLTLDLLDRRGKHPNGFCHWPLPIHYKDEKRQAGSSNFTCNAVYGQLGSGREAYVTLFHEGGHAAHLLNSEQTEICLNHEYPPTSTAWAETHSMFMDTMLSSIEWRTRYATNAKGKTYPFDLFERKVRRLHILWPLALMGIISMSNFEKNIYEEKNLTAKKVLSIAKKTYKKYYDYSVPSARILNVPHIYSWASTCSYHGYGLAELAVSQWREYFYKKYGYIVDNKNVGREMKVVWKLAGAKTFKEFVRLATGRQLSADAWTREITRDIPIVLKEAKTKIKRLAKVPRIKGKINLGAKIKMVSGKKTIADNSTSFESMTKQYASWLQKQKS